MGLVLSVTALFWLTINLLNERAFFPILQIIFVLALGCLTLLFFSKKSISLRPLRALELLLFGTAAAYMGLQDFTSIDQSAALGDSGMALSGLLRTVLRKPNESCSSVVMSRN